MQSIQHHLGVVLFVFISLFPRTHGAQSSFVFTNIDSSFTEGLAALKETARFVEESPVQTTTDWKPNLQLLVGVKATEASKLTVHFVQLTTIQPPATNAGGRPWQPILRTNNWAWSATNKFRFITTHYPVRIRVFDKTGRMLKEGQTPMAWGMLTNGLMDLCRLSVETYGRQTNELNGASAKDEKLADRSAGKQKARPSDPISEERLLRAVGGSFLWMMGMLSDLQTVPAVADVWDKAQCAIRWPSAWTVAKSVFTGFTLDLAPHTDEVSLVTDAAADSAAPLYCLPVDLRSDRRLLGRVEIIVGPAHGAEMLLSGIRAIHARHPTKPKDEFLTQVLASGSVREP